MPAIIDPSSLQSAKSNLRKSTTDPSGATRENARRQDSVDRQNIRAVTGIHTDEGRVSYFLDGGIDAWYDELKGGLQSRGKTIDGVTFHTTLVSLKREEKLVLHSLFKEGFADIVSVEDTSIAVWKTLQDGGEGKHDYFSVLQDRITDMRAKIRSECRLSSLCARLDKVICEQHGKAAFVKLTTRSPKDSYHAICEARRALQETRSVLDNRRDDADYHNQLWISFAENLRLQQCVESGETALLLLATSNRVHEDLTTDLFENPGGTKADQIQLSVRTFDVTVAPHTEFRGFVWNQKFVCCGQYFHQLHFSELQDQAIIDSISSDLRQFYDETLAPNMAEFLRKCPCFMMDLVWKQSGGKGGAASTVMLTEINPFDGEAIGVFPASTGLFNWDRDRKLMIGGCNDFELRVRTESLITSRNLKSHPDLKNLSPVWKGAIYGRD